MLQRTLTFFFLLINIFSYSQQLSYKQGEMIVQFHPKVENIQPVLQRLHIFQGRATKIKAQKCLSESMNVWLLKFDFTTIHDRRFLSLLQKDRLVQIAQFNHIIKYRNTPNDPDFMWQWQYINDGSFGGNTEADMDADLAWDITTGGVTADGDTIVVVALDGGIDLNHEDFGDNLWRNHQEIPDNGIDDDNNGFIDDVNGWNVPNENGVVTVGNEGHGTAVMGIIGARGNNGIGVTGVNWKVKVMMVQTNFFADEASLLVGYGYPLAVRKRYNDTNGAEGAFIVATNASWGTDEGMPEDAPIWCALYDSLGAVGILNCGATTNENWDIDVMGDLPTTCPSDYLIGVTNINRTGEKEFSAGYGRINIDLGAFGTDVFTLARGNNYSPFGGTSGATPHVTGAIGLLYSAPCTNFINFAKSDPAGAALLAKKYLLDGVKPNESLDTITVTGGQLNLNNSLQLLIQDCGPCPQPLAINVSDVLDISAQLNWNSSLEETSAKLRYRTTGNLDWTEISNVTTPYVLTGLTACMDYDFQLKSDCDDETSGYSRTFTFKTDGCCTPPMNIRVTGREINQLKIEWDALFAAKSYEVRFNIFGSGNNQVFSTENNFMLFEDLTTCTDYEFQIRTICETMTTEFSALQFAQTKGCGSCTEAEYCSTLGDSKFEWISNVQLNTISNETGPDEGYGDYTGLSTDLNTLETYDLAVNVSYQSFPFVENFQVWIDYNQDGVFDELTENVVNLEEDVTNELKTQITIPETAMPGLTRMRISMKWREGPNPDKPSPCLEYNFGEVEDYCVHIIQTTAPCFVPEDFELLDARDTIAFVSWKEAIGGLSYNFRYRIEGTTDWINAETESPNTVFISGLTKCSSYELQAKSLCDSMLISEYSSSFFFNTDCECLPVTNIKLVDSTLSIIRINWDAIDFADKYEVLYKAMGEINQRRMIVNTNQADLIALSECTNYSITIRGFCLDTDGTFSEPFIGSTRCRVGVLTLPADVGKIAVYPNPFKNNLALEIDLKKRTNLNLKLFDISGKMLKMNVLESIATGLHKIDLDYGALENGIYLLSIETTKGKTVRRLIKMRSF